MSTLIEASWSEQNWQDHVNALLQTHHAQLRNQYILIPDKVQGDGGLEGFSSDGIGYQCYADQESVCTADRSRKQCKKISDDLPKLEKYQKFWARTLQQVKLRCWVLVVPNMEDKAVVTHAREQAELIRRLRLPFIADDFHAVVKTDKDFPEAYKALTSKGIATLTLSQPTPTPLEKEQLSTQKRDLIQIMDDKISRMNPEQSPEEHAETKNDLLLWYLKGENLLEQVKTTAPWLWEPIKVCIDQLGATIRTTGRFPTGTPNEHFLDAKSKLDSQLKIIAQALSSNDVDALTWAAVTQWLMDCSLNFPKVKA